MHDNLEYNHVPYSTSAKFGIYPLSDKGIEQYTKDSLIKKYHKPTENKRKHELFEDVKKRNDLQEMNNDKNLNLTDDKREDQKEIKLPVGENEQSFLNNNDSLRRIHRTPQYEFI